MLKEPLLIPQEVPNFSIKPISSNIFFNIEQETGASMKLNVV